MPVVRRTRVKAVASLLVCAVSVDKLIPDTQNPREASEARMGLLRLSLDKLGFLMPVLRHRESGLLLSGHQRLTVAKALGLKKIPCMDIELDEDKIQGINILANRATNDFTALDTGGKALAKLNIQEVIEAAEKLPYKDPESHAAYNCAEEPILPIVEGYAELYDKKAVLAAHTLLRKGVRIPAVVTVSGKPINGIYRLFSALESKVTDWPVVRIPDEYGEVAAALLNYLSMDYKIDGEFKELLRAGAFRRASNDKSVVSKSYRFWANGCKPTLEKDSYTAEAWNHFRHVHGHSILDFGAGLGKVAPYLQSKGMDAIDFEPYRILPDSGAGKPDPDYSRIKAKEFLQLIANPKRKFDSIFLSSVLNSVPFPEDRLMVLAIVHALCTRATAVYGSCRDIGDFSYEYGGERRSVYFTMDGEPGVRIGDIASCPKLQKFTSHEEARAMFSRFWKTIELWPNGNIFMFKLTNPIVANLKALGQSLDFEFNLPFLDGSRMDLAREARMAFARRLMLSKLP